MAWIVGTTRTLSCFSRASRIPAMRQAGPEIRRVVEDDECSHISDPARSLSPRRSLALCLFVFGLGKIFARLVFTFFQIAPQFFNDALQVLNGRNFVAQRLGQLAGDAVS